MRILWKYNYRLSEKQELRCSPCFYEFIYIFTEYVMGSWYNITLKLL